MKKTMITAIALLFTTLGFSQKVKEADVPTTVKTAFKAKYPTVAKAKWDKEEANYEASFDMDKADHSVLMDASGNILETEVEIEISELPNGIAAYVQKNYAGQKMKEAAKITDAKGSVSYEVELKGLDVIFDSKGNFIKDQKG